jgi:hypothetical protein
VLLLRLPCPQSRMADANGVVMPKHGAEHLVQEAAHDCEAFYQARTPLRGMEPGPILVASLDGTGVPRVRTLQDACEHWLAGACTIPGDGGPLALGCSPRR